MRRSEGKQPAVRGTSRSSIKSRRSELASLSMPTSPSPSQGGLSIYMGDSHSHSRSRLASPQSSRLPHSAMLPPSPNRHTSFPEPQTTDTPGGEDSTRRAKSHVDTSKIALLLATEDLSSSMETVRAPSPAERSPTPPLIPFPPWAGDASEPLRSQYSEGVSPRGDRAEQSLSREMDGRQSLARPETGRRGEDSWVRREVMHGVVLAMQCGSGLVVGSVLVWVTVWQRTESSAQFWEWLWRYIVPSIGITTILCFIALLVHEIVTLATVVHLYTQSVILLLSTTTSLALWTRVIGLDDQAAKGVLMGCDVFIVGMALLGFVRAAVVWRVEHDEDRGRGSNGEERRPTYGSLLPWYEESLLRGEGRV